jgi:hypothetical protein
MGCEIETINFWYEQEDTNTLSDDIWTKNDLGFDFNLKIPWLEFAIEIMNFWYHEEDINTLENGIWTGSIWNRNPQSISMPFLLNVHSWLERF